MSDSRCAPPWRAGVATLLVALSGLLTACASGGASVPDPTSHSAATPATAENVAPSARTARDGVYGAEQASRGAQAYARSCTRCHGRGLRGGEMAPALAGNAFTGYWAGQSLGALLEVMETSMPPANPGGLAPNEYRDILAYLLRENGYPAGDADLPQDRDALSEITIVGDRR